ncbi:MAG TPA: hypothetical protein VFM68_04485 [Candidatus Saccharimonadales bacterium]|nr:hypothetical protein [Candidatus Saccharimonadales bacterium]
MSESEVDFAEPEPPSFDERTDYKEELFRLHDRLKVSDRPVRFVNDEQNIDIELEHQDKGYGITAELTGQPVRAYRTLNTDSRFQLQDAVADAMDDTALQMVENGELTLPANYSIAMMNYVPLMFEPYRHAMLQGRWADRHEQILRIESYDIAHYQHQRLLIGGLAAFLTFLEEQK